MKSVVRPARRAAAVATALAVALGLLAVGAWQYGYRTRPAAVAHRFLEAATTRHPGLVVERWNAGIVRLRFATGLYAEVRLADVIDRCGADRVRCSEIVDRALDDLATTERAALQPDASMLQAFVVRDATPGYLYGFLTEPLAGPLEVRYALVDGVASTFVTAAIADRLKLRQPAIREAAIAALEADRGAGLDGTDAERAAGIYRVRAAGDPVASLIDIARMRRIAAQLATTRVVVRTPSRGVLYVAADGEAERRSLLALPVGDEADAGRGVPAHADDVLAYDIGAGGLSLVTANDRQGSDGARNAARTHDRCTDPGAASRWHRRPDALTWPSTRRGSRSPVRSSS